MNCEEYREAIAADPSESFDGGAAHSAGCPSCSAYKTKMRALDEKIAQALAVDVPELKTPELPPIGEHDKVVELKPRGRFRRGKPAWIALAAGIALAAVVGSRLIDPGRDTTGLAEQVLVHLDHEPQAFDVTDVAVSDSKLYSVVRPAIATLDRKLGLITYAKSCKINGREVPHLVVQGEIGPVTILLMPHEMVDMAVPVDGESVEGVILPVGSGSIAIIGDRGEPVDRFVEKVTETVRWSI